jgi:hypothetical protein
MSDRTSYDAPCDSDSSFAGELVSFFDETFQLVNCSALFEETYKAVVETRPTIWRTYPELLVPDHKSGLRQLGAFGQ